MYNNYLKVYKLDLNLKNLFLIIVMIRNFNPSEFFMIVDKADNQSISRFKIACENRRIRFRAIYIDFIDIQLLK